MKRTFLVAAVGMFLFGGVVQATVCDDSLLLGSWLHDNGSDEWDESAIGAGRPGGVMWVDQFMRIQDPGDPRDYGLGDPGSNRKIYLGQLTTIGLDGAHVQFRARIATGAPLDDMHPDGGGGVVPWPADGDGYLIHDGGKGNVGIVEAGVGAISFSLAKPADVDGMAGYEGVAGDVLLMNNLNGTAITGDVDTGETGTANYLFIGDATVWHDFSIDIAAGGAGTHQLSVSLDGAAPVMFDITAGDGFEKNDLQDQSYLAIGAGATGQSGAFDIACLQVTPEPTTIVLLGLGAVALRRRRR